MQGPLVSIIITTYKRSDFLEEAITSVLNQTYNDIEVLVMDDNDENSSYSLEVKNKVRTINQKDKRVHYYSMGRNGGAVRARNTGVAKAKGEFINFLDDDDLLLAQKIEKQIEKFNQIPSKYGMVGGYELITDEKGQIIAERKNKISGDVFVENLCSCICQTSVPLIRKDVFVKAQGFGEIPSSQEHYMLARVLAQNPYYDYIDDYVVKIRHHNGPRISNGKGKIKGALLLAEKFKQYYNKLTVEQIKHVEVSMNKNIFLAYMQMDDRLGALKFYLKSKSFYKNSLLLTLKMFAYLCLGNNGLERIQQLKYILKKR